MLPNIRDPEIAAIRAELINDPTGQGYDYADLPGKARLLVGRAKSPDAALLCPSRLSVVCGREIGGISAAEVQKILGS